MNDVFSGVNSMDIAGGNSMSKTLITKDTVLVGTIAAESSIIIDGGIRGDVFSKNSIELNGKVDGNMKANDISITDGAVKGDISSQGNILVAGDSVIVGNLFASSLEFNGKIKGNVRINGHAIIRENAVIHGNLSACNFTVDDGAKIIGFVEILRPVEVSGQPTEKIEDIVDFEDIEIPEDAGTPDSTTSSASAEVSEVAPGTPLFSTVSSGKEELITAPEEVVVDTPTPVAAPAPVAEAVVIEAAVEETIEEVDEVSEVATADESDDSDGTESFVDEKQKMLQDLRSRMEKAKKSGQSL